MEFRRGREFGRRDNSNGQTLLKVSERKQLYSRIMRDEVPFARSVQMLTYEVNIHAHLTETHR